MFWLSVSSADFLRRLEPRRVGCRRLLPGHTPLHLVRFRSSRTPDAYKSPDTQFSPLNLVCRPPTSPRERFVAPQDPPTPSSLLAMLCLPISHGLGSPADLDPVFLSPPPSPHPPSSPGLIVRHRFPCSPRSIPSMAADFRECLLTESLLAALRCFPALATALPRRAAWLRWPTRPARSAPEAAGPDQH